MVARLESEGKTPKGATRAIGSKVSGAEIGAVMSFMSGKVLGQFDPFFEGDGSTGRLMLVAPNIVQAERQLNQPLRVWTYMPWATENSAPDAWTY